MQALPQDILLIYRTCMDRHCQKELGKTVVPSGCQEHAKHHACCEYWPHMRSAYDENRRPCGLVWQGPDRTFPALTLCLLHVRDVLVHCQAHVAHVGRVVLLPGMQEHAPRRCLKGAVYREHAEEALPDAASRKSGMLSIGCTMQLGHGNG